MAKPIPVDNEREERITMEIIVDANGPEEQAMGWYYYLEGELRTPFSARCSRKRSTSPLKIGQKVEVVGMADQSECEREMFVTIRWKKETLAVPLAQLDPMGEVDESTWQAIEDWHYWVGRGYEF